MAKALPAGRPVRRRAMFGLFDSDSWAWATAKALFWLLVIIVTLGYIPDRAYYFVVSRTIELGILGWSPVNLCPPENGPDLPCPAPVGAVLPWKATDPALPTARTGGAAAQLGTNLLYIGGLDGDAPSDTTFVATVENGTVGAWSEGPALPEGRANAALAILSGTAYLIGGTGPDGPTDTIWSIGLDPDSGELAEWTEVEGVALPEPREGAAAAAVTDGVLVAGGLGGDGTPTATVWKSTLDDEGALGEFAEQPGLVQPVTDATMTLEGTYLWVFGGADQNGPTAAVQRASFGSASSESGSPAPNQPTAAATAGQAVPTPAASGPAGSGGPGGSGAPGASGAPQEAVSGWQAADGSSALPAARTNAGGFAANGALYVVGGSDGSADQRQLYWALPDAAGNLPGGWHHLDATDLPEGRSDAAAVVSGVNVHLLGGTVNGSAATSSVSANLAPEEPFFRLGIAGLVVPALQIGGEIGQQLGYLAAAGVGTGNFVLLVAIGWAFNNRSKISGWTERRRAAREARAPKPS